MNNDTNMLEIKQAIETLCNDTDGYKSLLSPFSEGGSDVEVAVVVLGKLDALRYYLCECAGSDHNTVDEDMTNYYDPSAHAMYCPIWIRAALVAVKENKELPQ